jgi:hypothetical protein
MIAQPMFAIEIAQRLGIALETFYRNRQRYHLIDKMPRPINSTGRPAYDRAGMEAWLTRNDPRRPPAMVAANDAIAQPPPNSDGEWNAFLHQHYRQPAE